MHTSKTHRAIISQINRWGKFGNIDRNFLTLFNRLSDARRRARYEAGSSVEIPEKSQIKIVEEELFLQLGEIENRIKSE